MSKASKVRYLVEKSGGGRNRYYWQPSAELRREGHRSRRLSDDPIQAAAEAVAINAALDAERGNAPVDARGRNVISRENPSPFLYIVASGEGRYKVGVSSNPQRRLATLATGSATPLHLVLELRVEHIPAIHIESRVLATLAHDRLQGEWLDTPLAAIFKTIFREICALSQEQARTGPEQNLDIQLTVQAGCPSFNPPNDA